MTGSRVSSSSAESVVLSSAPIIKQIVYVYGGKYSLTARALCRQVKVPFGGSAGLTSLTCIASLFNSSSFVQSEIVSATYSRYFLSKR